MKPFLKWVGGKQKLLPSLLRRVPPFFKNYHEPFLGAGALFFELSRRNLIRKAFLSDANERLIRTYLAVRNQVEEVIDLLSTYQNEITFFKRIRNQRPEELSDVEAACWFIYLNRTCFNGLYRVNRSNIFNVPFGKYKSSKIYDADLLRACSSALQRAHLSCECFEKTLFKVEKGDFVYFDPPYFPISVTSNFTSYTDCGFSFEDQLRLKEVSCELRTKRSVYILLSNSCCEQTLELYRDFHVEQIEARRTVSASVRGRGKISEILVW